MGKLTFRGSQGNQSLSISCSHSPWIREFRVSRHAPKPLFLEKIPIDIHSLCKNIHDVLNTCHFSHIIYMCVCVRVCV